jgi:hypothetical protein
MAAKMTRSSLRLRGSLLSRKLRAAAAADGSMAGAATSAFRYSSQSAITPCTTVSATAAAARATAETVGWVTASERSIRRTAG